MAGENNQTQYRNGPDSTMAPQLVNEFYQRNALIEARKTEHFGQLADTVAMPKNMGKKIVRYHWIPLLDDANVNDQGIDAAGVAIANGNLYGSSKDIGTISGKLPMLSEVGGRVNRVGFKRKTLEGTFEKFGFFDEYTQESLDFDTEADLLQHINREMINGAHEIVEDTLQIDLLTSAGVVKYAGAATSNATIDHTCIVNYRDFMNLQIDLDNNRTPKSTKIITGTRMVDTKTLGATRVMYCGSEMLPTLAAMKDLHGERAFITVEKYAAGGSLLNDEAGATDQFHVVIVPEMLKWAGAGANATDATVRQTNGKYDVYPMLVVGDESFTTISFKTSNGGGAKFQIFHKKPGEATADRFDPYGETGFMSIKWFYGFMVLRPERIGLIKTAAKF